MILKNETHILKRMNIFLWPLSFLFLLMPFIFYFLLPAKKEDFSGVALKVPFFKKVQTYAVATQKSEQKKSPRFFIVMAWILLTLAAARPIWYPNTAPQSLDARNIVLSLDVSESMSEEDFLQNGHAVSRLEAVKNVVNDFLNARKKDNIGFVLFGNEAYTYAPLSYDKKTLKNLLDEIGLGIAGKMTALGDGLALGIQTALKVPAKSRIVILLSDGYANAGVISVNKAIELAQKNNVKVYTIGVGTKESEFVTPFGLSISAPSTLDEQTLKFIATQTKGKYFLAQSTDELKEIYQIINQLETDKTQTYNVKPRKELFYIPLFIGMIFLALAFMKRRLA